MDDENLSILLSMGFPDIAECKRALQMAKGDVNEAVGILTNETPINSFGTLNDLTADIEMTDQTSSPIDLQNDRFPTTNFYELEQRVFQDNWSIPYKKDESLGKCINACIRMAEMGLLTEEKIDKECSKFLDTVMPEAFKKLLSSNATAKWNREIQEGIYNMLELFVDLIVVILPKDTTPDGGTTTWTYTVQPRHCTKILETLALAFDLDNDWNCKNKDQSPMGRWQPVGSNSGGDGGQRRNRMEKADYALIHDHVMNNYGWLCDMINRFGDGEGFEMILRCLNREEITCKEMAALLQPLANTADLLNREVLGEKMQVAISVAFKQIQKLDETELKTKDAFAISDLMGALKVLCHFFDPDKTGECDKLRLSMICRMLKTPQFGTRMNGLKEVSRLIEESEQSHLYGRHRHIINISSDQLVDWMAENSVLSVALEGNIDQVQYTDRIRSIFNFLCPKLGKEDLEKIWRLHDTSFNSQIMENIHAIMASAASRFSLEQYEHLSSLIKQKWEIANDRVREKLLHLIGQIGREARQTKSIQATLQLLWEVSHLETLPRHLVERALSEQLAIINEMSFDRDKQRRVYIQECLDDIKGGKKVNVLPAVVHLHNLCKFYSRGSSSFYQKADKAALSEMNRKHEVVKLLSISLQKFHAWAYEEARREISTLKKDTIVDGRYTHEDFIVEHLKLMKFFLQEGDLYLSLGRVNELWSTLVENPKAIAFDRESCLSWFQECLTDLDNDVQLQFFRNKLLSLSPVTMTPSSFGCFKDYLESVNINAGKIRKNSISTVLIVDNTDLIGIDHIWSLVTESSNEGIASEAIDYLLKLSFLSVSSKLKKDAAHLHRRFINKCYEKLESVTDFSTLVTEKHKAVQEGCELETSIGDESMTTLISKSTLSPTNTKGVRLQMIRRLINMAERYVSAVEESHLGNRNLRPHATTFYGPPIQIKVIYESKKDEFMIESHTNELISQVKIRISEKLTQNVGDLNFHCADIALTASKDRCLVSSLKDFSSGVIPKWTVKLNTISSSTSCALVVYDETTATTASSSTNSLCSTSGANTTSGCGMDARQVMLEEQEKSLPGVIISSEEKVFTLLYKMAMVQDSSTLKALRALFHLLPTDLSILEIFDCVTIECSSDKSGRSLASADASPKLSPRKMTSTMNPQAAKEKLFKLFDISQNGMSPFRLLYNLEVLLAHLMPIGQVDAAQQFSYDFLRNGGLKVILNLFDRNALPHDTDYDIRQNIYTIALQVARFLLCGESLSVPVVAAKVITTSPQAKPTPPKKSALDASVTSQSPITLSAYKIVQTMSDSEFLEMITCLMRVIWAAGAGNLQLATSSSYGSGNETAVPGASMRLYATRRSRDSSTGSSTESYTGSDSGAFETSTSPNLSVGHKQCEVSQGDILIATEALDLLATCLQLRNHHLTSFYNLPNVSEFILEILLYSSSEEIRKAAANRLKSLATIRPSVARSLILDPPPHPGGGGNSTAAETSLNTNTSSIKLSPRLMLTKLILKAPVPLWMPSCKARGTSHILLGQCSEYFDVRCYLLRGLTFNEQEALGENAKNSVEDELTFLQNYVPCGPRVEDCTLLAGHLKLVDALVSADGVSAATVGKTIIPVLLDSCLFPASQVISESYDSTTENGNSLLLPHLVNSAKGINPRCDTYESRLASYHLLVKLAKECPANLTEIVKFLVKAHHGYNDALAKEFSFEPLVDRRAKCGFVGLKNAGATCYMNSVLQQLYTVPGLRDAILNQYDESEEDDVDEETIFFQLQNVFGHLRASKLQFYVPEKFWSVARLYGQPVNVREQQDAFEFYTQIIDQADEYLAEKKKSKVFSPFFEGVFSDQMICQDCPHRYEREQSFLALNLIVKSNSLLESLDQFVRGEMLDGENAYFCEKCQEKRSTVKRMCIKTLPKTLVIQLKRFHYDYETNRAVKFDDYFDFPRSLEMSPYTADGIKKAEKLRSSMESSSSSSTTSASSVPTRTRKVSVSPTFGSSSRQSNFLRSTSAIGAGSSTKESNSYPYDLVGIVVHSGQANAGHYYSFIKDRQKNNTWLKFNDTTVEEFEMTDEALKQECFGGSFKVKKNSGSSHLPENRQRYWNAYMLFYESRTSTLPVPARRASEKHRGHTVSVSALPAASGLPRSARKTSTPAAPPRESLSQLSDLLERGEKTGLFNRKSDRMPPRIEQGIQEENLRFLLNRDVYSEDYYQFICDLVSVNAQTRRLVIREKIPVAVDAVELAVNFLLNTYAHAKRRQKSIINDLIAAIEFYIENDSEACKWLTVKLSSNEGLRYVRPFLIECEAKEVRSAFSQLMDMTIEYHLVHFSSTNCEPIDKILKTSLNCINEDVANHIKHCGQFFSFLFKFAKRGGDQCKQLLDLNFFQGLIKLLLGINVVEGAAGIDITNRSRKWAPSQNRELGELHQILACLILACDNRPFGVNDGASKSLVKNRLDDNELDLLPMPVLMSDVLHGKLAPIFIREAVSACREVTSSCVPKIVQSLVHVTTEVALFSEQLMEELLRQYNNVSSGELKNLSSLLVEILTLSDSLQSSRIGYVIAGNKSLHIDGLLELVNKHQTNDSCRAYQCIKILVQSANKSTSVRDKLLEESEKWQFAVNWLKEKMDEEASSSSNAGESSTSGISTSTNNSKSGSTTTDLMWGGSNSNEDSLTRTFHRTTSAVVTLEEANAILAEFDQPSNSSNDTADVLMETDNNDKAVTNAADAEDNNADDDQTMPERVC